MLEFTGKRQKFMSTRSRIGIQLPDESILSVYHHWDGYPEWLGRILKTHYNTKEKIENLINGGDMSSCWTNEGFYTHEGRSKKDNYGPLYYIEREKTRTFPARHDKNIYEYLADNEEYAYIYTLKGDWICYNCNGFGGKYPQIVEIPSAPLFV